MIREIKYPAPKVRSGLSAYDEGYKAFSDGSNNPYEQGTLKDEQWQEGWNKAEAEWQANGQ